jgi:hypothetical protein
VSRLVGLLVVAAVLSLVVGSWFAGLGVAR